MLAFSAGCPGPGTHDPGFVGKEWSATIREFGVVPVFPPREDVQVGDIYISPVAPDEEIEKRLINKHGTFLPIPVLVGSVDLRGPLDNYYRNRLSFPPTPNAPTTQPTTMAQPHGDGSIYLTGDNSRLRLGGFPEFFSAQISQGGIDGLVPTEAVDIALGAFASANKTINVSVPMVESYGLPFSIINEAVLISGDGTTLAYHETAKAASRPATYPSNEPTDEAAVVLLSASNVGSLFDGNNVASTKPGIIGYLRLITEVYSTRSIDVSVQATNGVSGGANADLTTKILSKIPSLSATTHPSAPSAVSATQPASFDQPTPQQVAASLNNQLNQSLQAALPGVSVKFLSVTGSGVSMRRTYERPIVIGYRAVLIRVAHSDLANPGSSVVFSYAGSATSVVPTAKETSKQILALQTQLSQQFTKIAEQIDPAVTEVRVTIIVLPGRGGPVVHSRVNGGTASKSDEVQAAVRQAAGQAITDHPDELKGATVQ